MNERIGNVLLDDRDYPGSDLYSDGAVEDELLRIAMESEPEDFDRVVSAEKSWPVMYHFSSVRQNILSWYPVKKTDRVLEIGSGCGAVTGILAEMAGSVTCVELSKKRSLVNAWRNRKRGNIEIRLGNFQDVEKHLDGGYDLITLIGVFEYASGYIGSDRPYPDFLKIIGKHLKKGGKILMAIENRLGMKYFAGCSEDHTGRYFDGIEGYPGSRRARTFSKAGLIRIFEEAGFLGYRFRYPYPDYKFPMSIYSDDCLPRAGELRTNMVNYDRKRMVLFDEAKAYDELEDVEYPVFANSFFVELAREPFEKSGSDYVKFSNDRSAENAIRTDIVSAGRGPVVKRALGPKASAHIERTASAYEALREVFEGTRFSPNRCVLKEGAAEFEFLTGRTLEEAADLLMEDQQALSDFFGSFFAELDKSANSSFKAGDAFRKVFGDEFPKEGCPAPSVSDIDLVLNNIIVSGDIWNVIDYEWTFPFEVPVSYIKWRVIHYYLRGNSKRRSLDEAVLLEKAGISPLDAACFSRMEKHFQESISEGAEPLWKLYPYISPGIESGGRAGSGSSAEACIYFDRGRGFSEDDSLRLKADENGFVHAKIDAFNLRAVRIDPAETASAAELGPVYAGSVLLDPETFLTNGFTADHRRYLFTKEDPQIVITSLPEGAGDISFSFRVDTDPEELYLQTGRVLDQKDEEIRYLRERLAASDETLSNVLHAVDAVKETKAVRLYRKTREKLGKSDPFAPVRPELKNHEEVHLTLDRRAYQPEGIHLMGWFYDPGYRGERISVSNAAGEDLDVRVSREIRSDVNAALGITDGRKAGFHILIPYEKLESLPLSLRAENPRGVLRLPLDIETDRKKRKEKRREALAGKSKYLLPVSREYDEWTLDRSIADESKSIRVEAPFGDDGLLLSVVIPLYRTPERYLAELADSLAAQTYRNFEVCFADGSPDDRLGSFLAERYPEENRFRYSHLDRNAGIAGNTNEAVRMAKGDVIVLCDHDDVLDADALYAVYAAIRDGADIVYTDEDKLTASGGFLFGPNFKPDFSPDLLRSSNYICHLFAVRRETAEAAGPLRSGFDGAQDYDFILRCTENAGKICHVPKALYHWRAHPDSTAGNPESKEYAWENGRRAIEEHLARVGLKGQVTSTEHPGHYRVRYEVCGNPKVSILIPNRDQADTLRNCIRSITEKTTWKNLEILILENGSTEQETFRLYEKLAGSDPRIRVLTYEQPFNYAAVNNWGAKRAEGDYLLFLNNDTEVVSPGWIEELLGLCQRNDTGCVGAYLEYPDHTIQHTGVIVGMGGAAGHMFGGMDVRDYPGGGRCFEIQNLSAVTGACMMTKAELFKSLRGFDESFAIAYNDIDYCLKVREKGLLVSINVYAALIHYESKSRGSDAKESSPENHARLQKEAGLLREKWPDYFVNGDPYYNPNLSLSKPDFSLAEI